MRHLSRRAFLDMVAATGLGGFALSAENAWGLQAVANPLATYPSRDWERAYRDLFAYDSKYTFTCAPNDTHNCILNAYVRQGVIARIGPSMKYGEATDLLGNRTTHRWDPRVCQKGLALTRRFYGDRRVRGTMVRAGFKRWVDEGFPRGDDGRPPSEYFQRARDEWVRLTHEEAASIVARALKNIAETYSGEAGQARLRAQHYAAACLFSASPASSACTAWPTRWLCSTTTFAKWARTRRSARVDSTTTRGIPICRPATRW
jgi:nitrate reductase alpha subunit